MLSVINPVKIYRLQVADIIVSLGLISPLGVYGLVKHMALVNNKKCL